MCTGESLHSPSILENGMKLGALVFLQQHHATGFMTAGQAVTRAP